MILEKGFTNREKFKIQYGEIYSMSQFEYILFFRKFKIQYGEIYSRTIGRLYCIDLQFKIQYGEIYRYFYMFVYYV